MNEKDFEDGRKFERQLFACRDMLVESALLDAICAIVPDRTNLVAEIRRRYENADIERCLASYKEEFGDHLHGAISASVQRWADDRITMIVQFLEKPRA